MQEVAPFFEKIMVTLGCSPIIQQRRKTGRYARRRTGVIASRKLGAVPRVMVDRHSKRGLDHGYLRQELVDALACEGADDKVRNRSGEQWRFSGFQQLCPDRVV